MGYLDSVLLFIADVFTENDIHAYKMNEQDQKKFDRFLSALGEIERVYKEIQIEENGGNE